MASVQLAGVCQDWKKFPCVRLCHFAVRAVDGTQGSGKLQLSNPVVVCTLFIAVEMKPDV